MSLRLPNAPGHVYTGQLRCELCDYVDVIIHTGPNYDRGRWAYKLRKCPNCKQKGITSFLVKSLK